MKHRPGTKTVDRTGPVRARAEIDRIVISIGEAKPQQHTPRGLRPEGVDELFPHETHRGSAEDDDSLLVQSDDALVGTKVEQFGEVQILSARRVAP
jgi:hypothetical protein